MILADLELDLDVFQGPFDLLLALVLREEVELADVPIAEIVVAYVERAYEKGELDPGRGRLGQRRQLAHRERLGGDEEQRLDGVGQLRHQAIARSPLGVPRRVTRIGPNTAGCSGTISPLL